MMESHKEFLSLLALLLFLKHNIYNALSKGNNDGAFGTQYPQLMEEKWLEPRPPFVRDTVEEVTATRIALSKQAQPLVYTANTNNGQ